MSSITASPDLYKNIAERTGGEIYIGVVGPVRSGKSTFIRRFMESVVIPAIPGEYDRSRARDEMPQSAGGRTVMTTEPKFVPDEAVEIRTGEGDSPTICRVKMIDCVGYLIPEVLGTDENGQTRMVHTPWSPEPIPFEEAAEMGTHKVITEHATIGMLVTSDGTVGDIPRDNYIGAEERIARELTEIGKPFAIICNSAAPEREESIRLALQMEEKYGVPVALVNCLELSAEDIAHILEMVLLEFPVREVVVQLPAWMGVFREETTLQEGITQNIVSAAAHIHKLHGVNADFCQALQESTGKTILPYIGDTDQIEVVIDQIHAGEGSVQMHIALPDALYYHLLSQRTGIAMENETELMAALCTLAETKKEYDKFSAAIQDVNTKGYGVVMPEVHDLLLEEPEIVKETGGFGVRLRATAPSIHMIKTNITAEVHPIVGTEQQSEELVRYLTREFTENPEGIWDTNMLGRSLYDLVGDSLTEKMGHMPEDAREKFGETLSRILNEGASGLVCIIL